MISLHFDSLSVSGIALPVTGLDWRCSGESDWKSGAEDSEHGGKPTERWAWGRAGQLGYRVPYH